MGIINKNITKIRDGQTENCLDPIIIEAPLEIRIKQQKGSSLIHQRLAVTMCTPGHEVELISGFLFTEGIVSDPEEILGVIKLEEGLYEANLSPQASFDLKQLDRNFFVNSSCGICGKASKENIATESPFLPWASKFSIQQSELLSLQEKLFQSQSLFVQTGAVHGAALVNDQGTFLLTREDVGRHNAMDKVIGAALQSQSLPLKDHLVLVSGRASFELIQKAGMAGIPMLCAVGAPSSLAIECAQDQGMALVGFLKSNGFNIYCGAERITA